MVGRIAGITKMSDCERTLLRVTKDNRKTGHVGERAEICQLREMMKLFPTGGRFVSYGFTLYTNSQTTAMPSKATK